MNRQQMLQSAITAILMLLLAGCGGAATIPIAVVSGVPSAAGPLWAPLPTPSPVHGASGLGDSLYPGFGNGGYDVQHYTLDLTVNDVETSNLNGIATIAARATQALSSFNLDFIGLSIRSITVNEQPATFDRHQQELTVTPAHPLAASQPFTVQVTYRGVPRKVESVADDGQIGWVTFDGGSYVLSEPDGAATYFPTNDHPLDKATYTFRVTVPKPFAVAANGVLAQTIDHGNTTTFVWEEPTPMASYLTTVNVGKFDLEARQSPNGVPIRNYYTAGLKKTIRQPFARQGEMLALYSTLFGPYPFEVYGSIVLDTDVGTALEAQTLSIYGVDQIDLEDMPSTEQLVAHELAHQWFGDSVSVADWGDIWLNEGFGTYAEGLWIEKTEGAKALNEWVVENYEYAAEAGDEMVPPGKPEADDLFNEGVYCRGALTLHALRLKVGDKVFFNILREYYDRFRGGNARTSDFIAVAEKVSGQKLTPFFDSWLYSKKMPSIPALGLE